MFTGKAKPPLRDSKGKYFVDRDGVLFRYVLDFLRNQRLILPENFHEKERLRTEAEFYNLSKMTECIDKAEVVHTAHPHGKVSNAIVQNSQKESSKRISGFINVAYRGTFAFGRDGLADVKFRKLSRILVCGRVTLCREVFGETLNESRDPDRGMSDRYTGRFFLKHNFLEQAFDMLAEHGFILLTGCASGTSGASQVDSSSGKNTVSSGLGGGADSEESRWNHYNEFVFYRD